MSEREGGRGADRLRVAGRVEGRRDGGKDGGEVRGRVGGKNKWREG